MTSQKSLVLQHAIVIVFVAAMGLPIIYVCGSDLYHWYLTGELWVPAKHGPGWYTTSDHEPLFAITFGWHLLAIVAGIVIVSLGISSPASYRKAQQARVAWKEKLPQHPWPSRSKPPE